MPKVSEVYFENKRNIILDAAEKLCATKPLYKLTMKDIIKETKLSPGSVYASFSDIDDVIPALINRSSGEVDCVEEINQILDRHPLPEDKITAICKYMVSLVFATVATSGKMYHELNTLLADNTRRDKIEAGIRGIQSHRYAYEVFSDIVDENIASGRFTPIASKEGITAHIFAFIDGLMNDLILIKCYHVTTPNSIAFIESDLKETFAASIKFLLNPTEQEDTQ